MSAPARSPAAGPGLPARLAVTAQLLLVPAARLVPAALLAAAVRLGYLGGPANQFNADEATSGLMVREILRGRHYVFYAGQDYGGTLEHYLQAAAYLLLPMPQTGFTLRLPLVALGVLTCVLIQLTGERVLGDPARAALAAVLFAVSPWFNVVGAVTALGFYASAQALSAAVLLGALRAADGERPVRALAATGLCAGLALWTSPITLYAIVPAAVWLLPVLGRDARRWAAAAGGAVLGALPLLGWLARHRTLPLPPAPAEASTVPERLGNLAEPVLRQYVGVAYPHGDGGLWLPLQVVVVVALVAAYAVAVVRRRAGLVRLWRTDGRRPGDLLLAVPPVVVVLYAASDSTWYTGTPRYLLVTFPLLALGLAALVPPWSRRAGRVVAVLLVAASALLTLGFLRDQVATQPNTGNRDAALRQLTDHLERAGETRVWAGYWTAMPLQYAAGDRLSVGTFAGVVRFPDLQAEVAATPGAVYVGSDHDGTTDRVRTALVRRGVMFRETRVAMFTVFDRLSAPVRPAELGL